MPKRRKRKNEDENEVVCEVDLGKRGCLELRRTYSRFSCDHPLRPSDNWWLIHDDKERNITEENAAILVTMRV